MKHGIGQDARHIVSNILFPWPFIEMSRPKDLAEGSEVSPIGPAPGVKLVILSA